MAHSQNVFERVNVGAWTLYRYLSATKRPHEHQQAFVGRSGGDVDKWMKEKIENGEIIEASNLHFGCCHLVFVEPEVMRGWRQPARLVGNVHL